MELCRRRSTTQGLGPGRRREHGRADAERGIRRRPDHAHTLTCLVALAAQLARSILQTQLRPVSPGTGLVRLLGHHLETQLEGNTTAGHVRLVVMDLDTVTPGRLSPSVVSAPAARVANPRPIKAGCTQ